LMFSTYSSRFMAPLWHHTWCHIKHAMCHSGVSPLSQRQDAAADPCHPAARDLGLGRTEAVSYIPSGNEPDLGLPTGCG
jgi:hypothetical protein